MNADITIPKGDYGFDLNFTVQEDDGTPYVLTGYTIKIKVWSQDVSSDPIVNEECSSDVEADGTCHYTVKLNDFDNVGDYLIELELIKGTPTDDIESTRNYTLRVEESA